MKAVCGTGTNRRALCAKANANVHAEADSWLKTHFKTAIGLEGKPDAQGDVSAAEKGGVELQGWGNYMRLAECEEWYRAEWGRERTSLA